MERVVMAEIRFFDVPPLMIMNIGYC